jgi:FtsH-binding integral membrane protein
MSARYLTNLSTALLGGFLVVISMALAADAGAWVAFGVAIGVLAIAVLAQLELGRGLLQRLLDVGTGLVAVTLIVTSLVYAGTAVTWIVFGLALGFVGTGVAGLTLHEIDSWRAEHGLPQLHLFHRRAAVRSTTERPLAA